MALFKEKKGFFGKLSERIGDAIMGRPEIDEELMDELEEILKQSFARLAPGGVLAATAVLVESVCVLSSVLKEYRRELLTLNVARALPLAGSFCCKAENPVTLAVFAKKGDL